MTATDAPMTAVSFTQMKDGTKEDYDLLLGLEHQFTAGLVDRLLASLRRLDEGMGGFQISRLGHSLQTATRAEADGADIDMIVGALMHDIGDELAPDNHSQLAASVIRPYVRGEVSWVVEMHGLFQMYYFGHFRGLDRNGREAYRDHQWYPSCVDFCERWDQTSFDPAYATKPLEHFEPLVREVFARQPFDPATGCL
jgi:predicted HD phosphohydrolase